MTSFNVGDKVIYVCPWTSEKKKGIIIDAALVDVAMGRAIEDGHYDIEDADEKIDINVHHTDIVLVTENSSSAN
tara:strand:- start:825 stop:1046 length:222 start_codon:yes stop_codon:yes gene_type:complete